MVFLEKIEWRFSQIVYSAVSESQIENILGSGRGRIGRVENALAWGSALTHWFVVYELDLSWEGSLFAGCFLF